ncbi:MAG: dihydrolipoyl dehydrogenase [Hyphomicrobiaceae bacterium]
MDSITCKLLIIGAGPGGYVCAIRAGQLGLDTVIVDESDLGGTCLNVGCIPSKALIHVADEFHRVRAFCEDSPLGISAQSAVIDLRRTAAWKDGIVERLTRGVGGLLRKAKVKAITGRARFIDGKTVIVAGNSEDTRVRAEAVVIATGSAPLELPGIPFGGDVISSTEALSLTEIPKRFAIVGGGYIGMEIGTAFVKLGSEVTIIEAEDRILPQYDAELVAPVAKRFAALGGKAMTQARAQNFDSGNLEVEGENGSRQSIVADKVLIAVGRRPRTQSVGIEELSLTMGGPFVHIDDQCQTSMRGVYAIGDVTGEPMLAHRAMAQGEMVAEIFAGHDRNWDKACIPAVCFTDPEIVTVGLAEAEARTAGDVKVTSFPFHANGRSLTMGRDDGFVRVIARSNDGVILGLQAVGAGVSELSATFALAIEMGAVVDDIAGTIHAHPTLSEGFHEACLRALGRALHI